MLYQKGDFDQLNRLLHLVPWCLYMDPENIDSSWEGFLDIFEAATRDAIPWTKRRSRKWKPWISKEIKIMISKKKKLFRKAIQSNTAEAWNSFKILRKKTKYAIRVAYSQFINNLFSLPNNKKRFFAFIREHKRSSPPPVLVIGDRVYSRPYEIADKFLNCFQSSFSDGCDVPATPVSCDFPIPCLQYFDISSSDIHRLVESLPVKKAPGPDGLSPVLLKKTSTVSCPIFICYIFVIG